MPIKTQGDLPAKEILENENIFVMDESRAIHQDIRPLQVCILNLMPLKKIRSCNCCVHYRTHHYRWILRF